MSFMEIVEGFHIKLIKRGSKKGQECVNFKKKVCLESSKRIRNSNS